MPPRTETERYQRYATWCWLLGIQPASFDAWRVEHRKIYDRTPIGWYAQGGHRKQFT